MKWVTLIAGLSLTLPAGVASAQSFTMLNTTTVNGSNGVAYTAPNNYIGDPYQTLSLTVSQTGSTATLSYITAFSGLDNVAGYNVGYADVFFGGIWAGYAVSMGDQTGNGGLTAGVYQVQGAKTSQDIWGGRNNVIYGASYGADALAADTVLDSGTFASTMVLTETRITSGVDAGYYDVSFTMEDVPFNLVEAFEDGSLSAFWGTADCANGAFVAVPEPGALSMFAVSVLCVSFTLGRRRAA